MTADIRAILGVCLACMLCSIASGANFPKFKPIVFDAVNGLSKTDIVPAKEYVAPVKPKDWFASWPTSMRMTLLGAQAIRKLEWKCYTEPLLKPEDYITEMKFCFNDKCTTMTSAATKSVPASTRANAAMATIKFDATNGGSASFSGIFEDKDLSTKFSCSVTNRMGKIQSNELDVIDLRSRFPKQWTPNRPTAPLPKNKPHTFNCMKNPVTPKPHEPPFTVRWAYCSNVGNVQPKECVAKSLFEFIDSYNWPIHTKANGDLFVPYFPEGVVDNIQNHKIVCLLNENPVAYYSNPVQFSNDPAAGVTELKMSRPGKMEDVKIFNSPTTSINFPCNFEIGRGTYSVKWEFKPKGGKSTTILRSPARDEKGVTVMTNPHYLNFKGPFSDKTVGTYTCTVSWQPQTGTAQTAIGSYNVEVQFFPSVSNKMVPLKFVVDGDNGTVPCLFDDHFPTARIGLKVTPSLGINGQSIDLRTEQTVKDSIKTVNSKYKTVMNGLTVDVKPTSPSAGQVLTFTALKMAYRSTLNNLPSTHTVQCVGKNEVGSVRTNTLLKVVPKPILIAGSSPASLNCTECSAKEDHTVRCVVSNLKEINDSGVVFAQYWQLGTQRVDDLLAPADAPARKYLILSADKSALTIKKIDDIKFRNQVNDLGSVECVLTLGYPSGAKLPPEVKSEGVEKGLFFISSHSDMRKELTTVLKLTNIAPPVSPKTGGMMWLVPVILALIIILIIIGATYYYCRRRTTGEEYNVDAKEKQQGNDPEVDIAEKEAFPVYERPEDGPIRGSRASLDDSIHVGSDDEDEVLAEYDVDIGKFDEEGSFIGQYAVNDGSATGNRRLPQVSNNTEV